MLYVLCVFNFTKKPPMPGGEKKIEFVLFTAFSGSSSLSPASAAA
jgi:hypothetical protein